MVNEELPVRGSGGQLQRILLFGTCFNSGSAVVLALVSIFGGEHLGEMWVALLVLNLGLLLVMGRPKRQVCPTGGQRDDLGGAVVSIASVVQTFTA